MNIKEYIESGVLELYVAGMLPEDEAKEITSLVSQYPELETEVEAIEQSLGDYAKAYNVPGPSEQLLDRALAQIEEEIKTQDTNSQTQPDFQPLPNSSPFPKYLLWAAIMLLLISFAGNIYQYQLTQNTQSRVEELIQTNQELQNNLTLNESVLALYENPDFNRVILEGQSVSPSSSALVYWNPNTSEVFLQASRLPQPPTDAQYQLWAIQDGQPVDAGIFDLSESPLALKDISGNTQSFAITLEPKGGSLTPTLEQLYVIGDVQS